MCVQTVIATLLVILLSGILLDSRMAAERPAERASP
jgi:hypothetical protein